MTHDPPPIDAATRRAESARRIEVVREATRRLGAAGTLLRSRHGFAWLTVGGVNHVLLSDGAGAAPILVTSDRATVLAPVNEAARLRDEEVAGLDLEVEERPWEVASAEADGAPGLVDEAQLEGVLLAVRSILVDEEAQRLAWLGERARLAIESALDAIVTGTTEDGIAGDLLARLGGEGIRVPVILVAADERIDRYRHPLPTARCVERRAMVVVVAERWGLHVALTRFRELEDPGAVLARRSTASAAILRAMEAATRPGRTMGDVLADAQRAYADAGFADEWRLHHQGGSIGYRPRERIAVPGDPTPILPGMAFAWNPSITGAKAEDTIRLAPDGAIEPMTRATARPEPVQSTPV